MERETREVELPSGKKAKLKTYLTAGEDDDIQDVFLGSVDMNINAKQGEEQTGKFDGSVVTKAKYKALVTVVVSVDDKTGLKEGDFRNMRVSDVDFMKEECDKLTSKKK